MSKHSLLFALAAVLAVGCDRAGDTPAATAPDSGSLALGRLQLTPCSLPAPMAGSEPLEAHCGTFSVPENRGNPAARSIALNIAWIAPSSSDQSPDPVVFLAGGPGQSAVETFPQLAAVFKDVMKTRGVLLVDQRGTGSSNLLACAEEPQAVPAAEPDGEADAAQRDAWIRGCIDTLSKHADLRHYTTTEAVTDLDAVRQAIGVDTLNLVGVSYGTRVAQQYALRHPQRVRTITLDSPVPNTLGLGNIYARNLDNALAAQFALCKENATCNGKLGDTRAELQTLLTRLRSQPQPVTYRDAGSGEEKSGTLTADTVAGLVRMYAYMPAAGALLPQLIREANQGRYGNLMALAMMLQGEMKDAMALGMQLSVICSEDDGSFAAHADDAGTVLGSGMAESMAQMCALWPKGGKPADFNTPLQGDVPVLILTGEFDPVTPPAYGEQIAASLPKSRWLNLKGQGHNVIGAGCMPKLFTQFIEKADAAALDIQCLDKLAYVPPFTSFNGWEP